MPPSIVLEVLRILQAEVDLREVTRVAEQRRANLDEDVYGREADSLESTQLTLSERTRGVIEKLEAIQREEKKDYKLDLQKLAKAEQAMKDAKTLLAEPETGRPTIAAETEAIEALLATKRGSSKPSSSSGGQPRGEGNTSAGSTELAAVALIGLGEGRRIESRLVRQGAGDASSDVPEEFRRGLDDYFSEFEGDSD